MVSPVSDEEIILNKNIEDQNQLKKIREEVLKKYQDYRKTISFLATDAPIEVLCLPDEIQSILLNNGILRVYELFDCDFVKIKGLGKIRIARITSSLNQFLSVL